jgi:hypothetical protein
MTDHSPSIQNSTTDLELAAFETAASRDPYVRYDFTRFASGMLGEKARTYLDTQTESAWGIWQVSRRFEQRRKESSRRSTTTDGGHASAECAPTTCQISEKNHPDIAAQARKGETNG